MKPTINDLVKMRDESICTFCNDNGASCSACDDGYQEDVGAPYCGDCLVPLNECAHAEIYKRERGGKR